MSTGTRFMEMSQVEYAIIVNALMNMRNTLKQEEKETDLVDKVIRKTIKLSPKQKRGLFYKLKGKDNYESR